MPGRLIVDFKKFRDIMAHKRVHNVIFYQMVAAFVKYCRGILQLQPVTHEPATTRAMSTIFARMADINVVTCAEWFLYVLQTDRAQTQNIARWMTMQVQNSSFAHFRFSVDENNHEILVTYDGEKTLGNTRFNTEWCDELAKLVQNSSVTYSPEEIAELRECYQIADELM
jgi:L-arabinose isomerase